MSARRFPGPLSGRALILALYIAFTLAPVYWMAHMSLRSNEAIVGTSILSPADLEAANINLVGGDPYSGARSIDQFHLFRPFPGNKNHRTAIKRLWHIGASTHPGPGLGGMSGHLAAQDIG